MPPSTLKQRLLQDVDVLGPDSSRQFFKGAGDNRWAETMRGEDSPTGRDTIAINFDKFQDAGATGFRNKMIVGESLHRLKDVDPARYGRIRNSALNHKPYMDWARRSYARELVHGERRSFEQWHDVSRLDQVIGGYIFAGDESLPTMREWSREDLPIPSQMKHELDRLSRDLNID